MCLQPFLSQQAIDGMELPDVIAQYLALASP